MDGNNSYLRHEFSDHHLPVPNTNLLVPEQKLDVVYNLLGLHEDLRLGTGGATYDRDDVGGIADLAGAMADAMA